MKNNIYKYKAIKKHYEKRKEAQLYNKMVKMRVL